jgi:hypothetical protein
VRLTRTVALAGLGAMTVALAAGVSQSQALAAAVTEPAAATAGGFVVHAGKLVLNETGGHYQGILPITARNTGDTAVTSANLHLTLPPGLRLLTVSDNLGGCTGGTTGAADCTFFGPLDAGATAALSVTFGSYAGPERHARILDTGTVSLSTASTPGQREQVSFTGVLAGRNGTTAHPRPYRPATTYDATLAQAGAVTVTALPDGSRSVRVPLTARYRTDAADDLLELSSTVPDGVQRDGVDPPEPCFAICPVPGGFAAKGDTRDFAALFTLPAELPTGTYTISLRVDSNLAGSFQADRRPSDNTVLVTFTA